MPSLASLSPPPPPCRPSRRSTSSLSSYSRAPTLTLRSSRSTPPQLSPRSWTSRERCWITLPFVALASSPSFLSFALSLQYYLQPSHARLQKVVKYLIANSPSAPSSWEPSSPEIIEALHADSIDPNDLLLCFSRNDEERKAKAGDVPGKYWTGRQGESSALSLATTHR